LALSFPSPPLEKPVPLNMRTIFLKGFGVGDSRKIKQIIYMEKKLLIIEKE
jgi:hypothetical protein